MKCLPLNSPTLTPVVCRVVFLYEKRCNDGRFCGRSDATGRFTDTTAVSACPSHRPKEIRGSCQANELIQKKEALCSGSENSMRYFMCYVRDDRHCVTK